MFRLSGISAPCVHRYRVMMYTYFLQRFCAPLSLCSAMVFMRIIIIFPRQGMFRRVFLVGRLHLHTICIGDFAVFRQWHVQVLSIACFGFHVYTLCVAHRRLLARLGWTPDRISGQFRGRGDWFIVYVVCAAAPLRVWRSIARLGSCRVFQVYSGYVWQPMWWPCIHSW